MVEPSPAKRSDVGKLASAELMVVMGELRLRERSLQEREHSLQERERALRQQSLLKPVNQFGFPRPGPQSPSPAEATGRHYFVNETDWQQILG